MQIFIITQLRLLFKRLVYRNRHIGKVYSEISMGLFGLKSGKHIIFYHIVSENEIEVIRILHERMDLTNRLT